MLNEKIHTLFAYHDWANRKIITAAKGTTDLEFIQIQSTLVHALAAEFIWRMRCQHNLSPKSFPKASDYPTIKHVEDAWIEETAVRNAWLHTLTDEDLQATISYTSTEGTKFQNQLWDILQHLALHGMQHRSEIAMLLTEFGHSPGDIDMIFFTRKGE